MLAFIVTGSSMFGNFSGLLAAKRQGVIQTALLGALLTAFAFPFITKACAQCSLATQLEPVPWLNLIGATYYLVLLWGFREFRINFFTASGLFIACGMHIVLLVILLANQLFCLPCCLCATFVALAALSLFRATSVKLAAIATISGGVMCTLLFLGHEYVSSLEIDRMTREAILFDEWPRQTKGPLKLSIYTLEKCPTCRAFKRTALHEASKRFGDRVELEYCQPRTGMMIPTVVVGGRKPVILIGNNPCSNELNETIDRNLFELTAISSKSGSMQ